MSPHPGRLLPLLLCAALAACGRSEPEAPIVVPPVTQSLTQIAQHSLASFAPEPSGLVYNSARNSFYVVSDNHADICEIDLRGRLIGRISTQGSDLEGVGLSPTGDTIYVVEERTRRVLLYTPGGSFLSSFAADVATLPNNGLEGVTVSPDGRVHALNEKAPGMILVSHPNGTRISQIPLSLAADYSDIAFVASEQCYWIISDESRTVMKTDLQGALIKQWNLPFEKGEGVAVVRDTMYIVNDADGKLHVFLAPK